ncbi:MAG: sensor histidine kinase [Myxococcaceae bacterium]
MDSRRESRRGSLVWLAAVVAAIVVLVAVHAWAAIATAQGARELSTNALRSVMLAEDMRRQLSNVVTPSADAERTLLLLQRDVSAYEPLATWEGERPEWLTLSRLTRQVREEVARGDHRTAERSSALAQESVERLIALNQLEASTIGRQLIGLGRPQVAIDGLVGVVVVLALGQLARSRLRALELERAVVALSLEEVEGKNRELDAFAGLVAHDLRLPLTPVQALVGLLARGGRSEAEVRRISERIASAASRMSGLIEAMLELSRSGQVPPGECSVVAAVEDVLEELGPVRDEVDLRVEVPEVQVACSSEVLGQIVGNLLGNAIKYRATDRRCQVKVSCAADGAMVRLAVSDNGIGMSPEAERRAFEPFFRASQDRPGHGLGLSIVERYVQALHGSVTLTSQPGLGTRVELWIPRAAVDPAARRGQPERPPAIGRPARQGLTIG